MRRNLAPSRLGSQGKGGFVPPTIRRDTAVAATPSTSTAVLKSQSGPHAEPQASSLLPRLQTTLAPRTTSVPSTNLKPLTAVGPASAQSNASGSNGAACRYFSAVWCKQSTRKHKKWEGDAFLIAKPPTSRLVILKDPEGKEIGRGSGLAISKVQELEAGSTISFSGKEVELLDEITEQQYLANCSQAHKENREAAAKAAAAEAASASEQPTHSTPVQAQKVRYKPFAIPSRLGNPFPVYSKTTGKLKPMFDPDDRDAVVMPRPGDVTSHDDVIDVVVDPHIGKRLRPHQIEGVIFLYKCVMGIALENNHGAILADEMGLGKTLQTIALVWTLLRQGPFGGRSVLKKVLVLAPSSLVKNWQAEFAKWLGPERISTFAVDNGGKLGEYLKHPASPVLIMSYEMFTRSFDTIEQSLTFELVVCDEGHRLKNASTKASQMLSQLDVLRRVVLTGTPLQNELKEFYAIVNLVCPDILGSESKFLRNYEEPIVRSKQPDAHPEEVEFGNEKMQELNSITEQFILRRTQDIISRYLPPKTECVIFCQMTAVQAWLFERLQDSLDYSAPSDYSCVLSNITQFRKVCNHPSLMENLIQESGGLPPELDTLTYEEQGSKLAVVSCILWALRQKGDERIVLVSISTKVLDLLGELCQHYGYPTLRLDGSTTQAQRDQVVQSFNSPHNSEAFVLLLSSKAGGTGLNLIGASRILLFDMDWNPATDVQAMARVWRDGQKRKVYVYRLATAGSIEEKIFQRQVTKQGIDVLSEGSGGKFLFSRDELMDLFSYNPDALCDTHQLLDCSCDGGPANHSINASMNSTISQAVHASVNRALEGSSPTSNKPTGVKQKMQDLLKWKHIDPKKQPIEDSVLANCGNYMSYVFVNHAMTRAE